MQGLQEGRLEVSLLWGSLRLPLHRAVLRCELQTATNSRSTRNMPLLLALPFCGARHAGCAT